MKRDILMARDCYDDCIAFLDEQLGRLLDELRGQGLLDNTDGDHHLGPWRSVRRSWPLRPLLQPLPRRDRRPAGDPLPGRPGGPGGGRVPSACATCPPPWSTCWVSRPAHRSRAARWRPTGGRHPGKRPQESPPRPSRSRPTRPRSNLSRRQRPRAPRVPDVPGGLGPSLHPGWHGGRAALRSEDRSVRAGQPHGLSARRRTRWESSERCSSTC